jgi:hypothetical protein
MKKIITSILVATTALTISASANAKHSAEGNSAGCGLGSTIFDGKRGLLPNILAATTNGTSGNQTFGMSTGTLGCNKNDVVRSKDNNLFAFANENLNEIAADASKGSGEYLDSVASIIEIKETDKAYFFKTVQSNFSNIFSNENTTTKDVVASLNKVIKGDKNLSHYAI